MEDDLMIKVAPLVGAWIEILTEKSIQDAIEVAPLVGAWIEIMFKAHASVADLSLLSWERGLK